MKFSDPIFLTQPRSFKAIMWFKLLLISKLHKSYITTYYVIVGHVYFISLSDQQYSVKQLEVIFSSYIANNSCKYIIDRDGIKAF